MTSSQTIQRTPFSEDFIAKQLVGVGTPPVERRLAWWIDNFRFKMERAVGRLQSGEWDLPTFQASGRQEIKDTLYGIAETGAGRRLTRKEIYRVRKTYKEQIEYWDKFAQTIEEQRKALAERGLTGDELEEAYNKLYAKFDRRAQSYYGAIEAEGLKWVLAQNEGRWYQWNLRPAEHCISCIERNGEIHQVKDGRLPYYPKDGSTQCLYNCLCYWKPVLRPPKRKRPTGERKRGRKLAEKHYGPGPHPGTGTPQSIHAGARRKKGTPKAGGAGRAPKGKGYRTIGQGGTKLVAEGKIPKRTVEKFANEFESLPPWAQEGIKELKLEAEAGTGFNAGGQQFVEGGRWEASGKRIVITNAKGKSQGSKGAIAHEVGHSIFDRLGTSAIDEEYKLIKKHPDWFKEGTLTEPRRLKAEYIKQAESSGGRSLAAMTKYRDLWAKGEDGITSYSKAWAREGAYSGQTETFAEMSKVYFGMASRGSVNRDVFLAHCSGARGLGKVFLEVTDIMSGT